MKQIENKSQMIGLNINISVTSLNINGQNTVIKRQMSDWILKKQDIRIYCLQVNKLSVQRYRQANVKT